MVKSKKLKIGDIYGFWEILNICKPKKGEHPKVEVFCTKCNNTKKTVGRYDLINGKTKMCVDCTGRAKGKSKYDFNLGYKKGMWKVIEINSNDSIVICKCTECNDTIKQFPFSEFKSTSSKMCFKCGRNKGAIAKTLTTEQYEEKLKDKNPLLKLKKGEILKWDG